MKIKEDKEYFGEMIHDWTNEHKNKYVITGLQQGGASVEKRVGRVAQVRIEAGDFGSDNVLLRHCDDVLQQHTNQSFWLIPDKFTEYLNECFKGAYLDDCDKYDYTLNEGSPERGFIINSKIKEGESTPMRDIKSAIYGKLSEL
jgi:hypothetical protein